MPFWFVHSSGEIAVGLESDGPDEALGERGVEVANGGPDLDNSALLSREMGRSWRTFSLNGTVIRLESKGPVMESQVQTAESAEAIAETYADEECVGTLGEVIDVTREDDLWVVEFRTHTFSKAYIHRIEITSSVGNVISHERNLGSS